jgi:uncharacterized membrane protein YfcA
MTVGTRVLVIALALVSIWYVLRWFQLERSRLTGEKRAPRVLDVALGFVTDFLDTLGIGSFAPTAALFKLLRRMPDEQIPGTLNAGHALPTLAEGLIFVTVVTVDMTTLVSMTAAAIAGAWFGAGTVSRLRRRTLQGAMGSALLAASLLLLATNLQWLPGGGHAIGLTGGGLAVAVAVNFVLGGLMTLGIGLYAPCLILVSLLGMNPLAAFPIMMASSAFVMAIGGVRFIRSERYSARAALGLALGGVPGVIVAAYVVKSLSMVWLHWLVVVVVLYAAVVMLMSAWRARAVGSVSSAEQTSSS